MTKHIQGTWFTFWQPNGPEGDHINSAMLNWSEEQVRRKVREMGEVGMEYIVLGMIAKHTEALYDTGLRRKYEMGCDDYVGALMDEASKYNIKVFMATGCFSDIYGNMDKPDEQEVEFEAMEELYEKYGHHNAFYGWYYPYEMWINGDFPEKYIEYINKYVDVSKKIFPNGKTLIAPFGTENMLNPKPNFVDQLKRFKVDFIAYQCEVGVRKVKVEELPGLFKSLKEAHDQALNGPKLWADIEIFDFEDQPYRSPLIPANIERLSKQIANISPYVEKMLCYMYLGMMSKPGSDVFVGREDAARYYNEYTNYLKENCPEVLRELEA